MGLYPVWYLLLFVACVFAESNRVRDTKEMKTDQTIGTVLFERSDYNKHCWSSEEFTLLNSRKIFQDLLPKVNVINSQNDQYIGLLMDYIHICLECIRKLAVGKTKNLMLKALADTVGGYLRVYILPLTRQSYYAGNIKYRNAKKLFELYDELKNFLHTNGAGWMKPVRDVTNVKTPLPLIEIEAAEPTTACNGLITYPASSKEQSYKFKRNISMKEERRRRKRKYPWKQRKSRNPMSNDGSGKRLEPVIVPLPFLDNDAEPNSIAMPFKVDTLQSLYCEKSAFALEKYYVASVKCITSRSKAEKELIKFNKHFYGWLQHSVLGHLNDEKWYPAFGGVLRVVSTLQEIDKGMHGKGNGTYRIVPNIGEKNNKSKEKIPLNHKEQVPFSTMEKIIFSIGIVLMVWLLIGLCVVCYKFLKKKPDNCSPCDSSEELFSVLHANKDFGGKGSYPMEQPRKGFFKRMKERWTMKFRRCPGGCKNQYADEEKYLAALSYSSKDTVPTSNSSKTYQQKPKKSKSSLRIIRSKNYSYSRSRVKCHSDDSFTNSEKEDEEEEEE